MKQARPQFIDTKGKVLMELGDDDQWHAVDANGAVLRPDQGQVPHSPPTAAEMAHNLKETLSAWARHGFPIASEEVRVERQATCDACMWWQQDAFFGSGRCLKCGCSVLKLALATAKCPIGKWPAVTIQNKS
jgi:hypothetical protein